MKIVLIGLMLASFSGADIASGVPAEKAEANKQEMALDVSKAGPGTQLALASPSAILGRDQHQQQNPIQCWRVQGTACPVPGDTRFCKEGPQEFGTCVCTGSLTWDCGY